MSTRLPDSPTAAKHSGKVANSHCITANKKASARKRDLQPKKKGRPLRAGR